MEDRYRETHLTWDKLAQSYEDHFMDLDLYNDTYQLFCDSLPSSNASVLEIGCGPGNITRHLLNLKPNLNILATDISENMILLAKKNNPQINAQALDGRNLQTITDQFDGIMCGFTIPYLSKQDCSKLIADCNKLLINDGVFYLSFVPGNYIKSGFITGSSGDRTYFYYHDLNSIKHELELNQFMLIDSFNKAYQKSDATFETHTILIVKKGLSPL